jgi:drug/metabolite transporter (DMT)-like permease
MRSSTVLSDADAAARAASAPSARRYALLGLLYIALAGVIWGTIPLLMRAADGASVVKVFYRVFWAGAAIWLWLVVTGRTREVTGLPRKKLLQLMGQGAILTVNWYLFLSALDLTNVATAELLGYTGPVFVALFAPIVTAERLDSRILLPLALAMGGIVVIMAPQGVGLHGGRQTLGVVFAAASAVTFAVLLLRSKKILEGVSGMALMAVEYPFAALLLLPFTVVAYARGDGPTGASSYVALLALGVVHTAIAGVIFLAGLRRNRTDRGSILTYTEPVSAIVFAALFLGEPLTWTTVSGGAMVVAGGAIVALLGTRDGSIEAPEIEPDNAEVGAG